MNIRVILPATQEPISLGDVKLYLRVDHDDEDTLIQSLIKVAREHTEAFTRRSIAVQTFELIVDEFPKRLKVPRPPLALIESVQYRDRHGQTQTLDPADYSVDTDSEPGVIHFHNRPGDLFPSGAVRVRFQAGYDAETLPEPIKQAIMLLVNHLYEKRTPVIDGSISQVPFTFEALLWPYRVWL
jgi:uncharacterized phiE125 gp8 family phage protein